MGNCEACLPRKAVDSSIEDEQLDQGIASGAGEEMVKVLRTTDNELFEFPAPVSVKDLLFGFQGFAVYPPHKALSRSPTSPFVKATKPDLHQRPLHPDTLLKLSHLYYLKPLANPSLIFNPDDTKSSMAKQGLNWAKPAALIKPFVNVGTYSFVNTSDKDLLLGHAEEVDMISSADDGAAAGDLIACKAQENIMAARDVSVQEEDGRPAVISSQEGSFKWHNVSETLTIKDAQAAHALPEASLAMNAHDRTSNDIPEGVFTSSDVQGKPSSFGQMPIDHNNLSQKSTRRKVRFSEEVEVIPSSNHEFIDSASTSPTCSPRSPHPVDEKAVNRCGKDGGQFHEQAERSCASTEELIPQHMSKTELKNGVVRLKVVISKKQLVELMAARASGDKGNNALMEKMLSPLLYPTTSSCHKSQNSFHGGSCANPPWRPSLHHIPENHHSIHGFV